MKMEMKKCSKCEIEKELSAVNFYLKKGKWRAECKLCAKKYYQNNKAEIKKIKAEYYQSNKKEIKENVKEYQWEHKEEIKEYKIKYYEDHKQEMIEYKAKYYQNNKDIIKKDNAQYRNEPENKKKRNLHNQIKRQIDPNFKLRQNVANSIRDALKINGSSKNGKSCLDYLPYTIEELRKHLESLFEPWMTWKNHGKYDVNTWNDNDDTTKTWQIDHIRPHSDFPYISMEDQAFRDCWALNNLQPLSAKQNVIEGAQRTRHRK